MPLYTCEIVHRLCVQLVCIHLLICLYNFEFTLNCIPVSVLLVCNFDTSHCNIPFFSFVNDSEWSCIRRGKKLINVREERKRGNTPSV